MKTNHSLAVKEGENRFRELVEQSSDWIWEVDETGIYTYSSPGVREILGYQPSEVVGKTPFDFMPAGEAEWIVETFADLLRARKPIENLENVNLKKDGSRVILETRGVPFFDAAGRFLGYRGMDRDITRRKEAEERLRRIGANLAQAQRIAHLGSWEWDIEENRLSWSDEMYRIFGIDPKQFGASYEAFLEAVHPGDRASVKKAVEASLLGQHYDIEYRVVRENGESRVVHAQGEVSFDGQGKPSRMLGTVLDITERKHIERKMMHYAEELKHSNELLQQLAATDMLTGIANRRKFYEMLEREFSKAKRHGTLFSLIMYDLDHFKQVNDLFGHDIGDEVLKTVTDIVAGNIRREDIYARWGGEEFVIMTPETGTKAAQSLAEKLRAKIASHDFDSVGKVTVSFGVTRFEPDDDAASLTKKADDALYLAKKKGRNRVECVIRASR